MQYPLENLHRFIIDYLHPVRSQNGFFNAADTTVPAAIESIIAQAKLALYHHFASANSPKQAKLLLYSMQVALSDLEETVNSYITLQPENGESALTGLYKAVLIQIHALSEYLEKNFAHARPLFETNDKTGNTAQNNNTAKWSTSLSVSQLALLMRLMVESGILSDVKNITQFAETIAQTLNTKRMMPLSPESLRIKYYTPESAAISIIKDYLLKMMTLLRQYGK